MGRGGGDGWGGGGLGCGDDSDVAVVIVDVVGANEREGGKGELSSWMGTKSRDAVVVVVNEKAFFDAFGEGGEEEGARAVMVVADVGKDESGR